MTEIKMTYADVVRDTVAFYETHPRAVGSGDVCEYLTEQGQKCAVSRWLDHEGMTPAQRAYTLETNPSATDLLDMEGTQMLHPSVRHLNDPLFWQALQRLHDVSYHWEPTEGGGNRLTGRGQRMLADLYKCITRGEFRENVPEVA